MSCPDHPTSAAQAEPCIPSPSSLPSPLKSTMSGAKSSSLWNQAQVQAHPASLSSTPATHQIPCTSLSWSLFQFLRCSWLQCIPFYLGKAQSKFSGSTSPLLVANLAEALWGAWREAGQLCPCPARARGRGMLTLCCSTVLGFPAASVAELGNANRDLLLSPFIRDNTNQVGPVAAWLHPLNAKFQTGCYCPPLVVIFQAKNCWEVWCKHWTNTGPFRISGAAHLGAMLSWVCDFASHLVAVAEPPSFAFHSTALIAKLSLLELIPALNILQS